MIGNGHDIGGGFVRPAENTANRGSVDIQDSEPEKATPAKPVASVASTSAPQTPTGLLLSTTDILDGYTIKKYCGFVDGDAIMGANVVKDFFAAFKDFTGGRVGGYEKVLAKAKRDAMNAMVTSAKVLGANAIIGIDIDYQTIAVEGGGSMMMAMATGTAVVIQTK